MKTIYIDERFVKSENKTIFSIVILSEKELKEIYKKVRDVIMLKETDKQLLPKLLSDIKLHKVKHKNYWKEIKIKLEEQKSISSFEEIPASKEDSKFAKLYADFLMTLKRKCNLNVIADGIDNKKFTSKIEKQILTNGISFANSHDEKGLQIADLFMFLIE